MNILIEDFTIQPGSVVTQSTLVPISKEARGLPAPAICYLRVNSRLFSPKVLDKKQKQKKKKKGSNDFKLLEV